MSKKIIAVVLLLTFLLSACGEATATPEPLQALFAQLPPPPDGSPLAKGTYVGALQNSNILIGLVVQDNLAGIYICDGDQVSEWFGGQVTDGKIDLTTGKQTRVVAAIGANIEGQVTLADGQTFNFVASPAVEGKTGLFRMMEKINEEEAAVTGWIVTENAQAGGKNVLRFRCGKDGCPGGK